MHDKGVATGFVNVADEVAHKAVIFDLVDADAVFDRDVDAGRVAHGFDAIGDQIRFQHQASAKTARLHALGRAAHVEVDLVIAPLARHLGANRQRRRVGAAQLQR